MVRLLTWVNGFAGFARSLAEPRDLGARPERRAGQRPGRWAGSEVNGHLDAELAGRLGAWKSSARRYIAPELTREPEKLILQPARSGGNLPVQPGLDAARQGRHRQRPVVEHRRMEFGQ